MDCEIKRLKQSHISIVKVRWNSRRGLEFTWEREDQMQKKDPTMEMEEYNNGLCATTATIPTLRLLHLRHCMGASVDYLFAGLRLEINSSLAQRSSTRQPRK
nr:putative reverse transcriptase domain-containing protein [Tanacetum cinerariifolium]